MCEKIMDDRISVTSSVTGEFSFGKEGGKVKKIWMMTAALGLGIWLTGCSPAFVPVEDPSEPQTEERNSPETEKEDQREDLPFSQFRKKNVGGS